MSNPRFECVAVTVALLSAAGCGGLAEPGPPGNGLPGPLEAVPLDAVEIEDSFWGPRLEINRTVTVPYLFEQNEMTGRVANFLRAAGLEEGAYEGRRFNDTDVYKAIEAASYTLAAAPDRWLESQVDQLIEWIALAQEEDGYLFPARTVAPEDPAPGVGSERYIHLNGSHELYNAGHLIEAAVAHSAATGKTTLLDVARRFADSIDDTFGPEGRRDMPGHEEIELALFRLHRATGEVRYRDLARFFLEQRGQPHDGEPYPADTPFAMYNEPRYRQDHLPVAEQREAVGHAVRATYLYAGMTDEVLEAATSGEDPAVHPYREALEALWQDVVATKSYLTGGIGARDTVESFGDPFELPNATAYTETCASIGNGLWNHRMFLLEGEARFGDVLERVLYNGALSGVSLEGDRFFYQNPLEADGSVGRREWFDVACCPANLSRLLAQLPGLIYAEDEVVSQGHDDRAGQEAAPIDRLWVDLYVGSRVRLERRGGAIVIAQRTGYPWDGWVELTVEDLPESDSPGRNEERELELRLRIPGWSRGEAAGGDLYSWVDATPAPPRLRMNGDAVPLRLAGGFAQLRRRFRVGDRVRLELPMPVRRVRARPEVAADRGRVALQRGPLVYAVEGVDHSDIDVRELRLPREVAITVEQSPELLGGIAILHGLAVDRADRAVPMIAIPYALWAHRGPTTMAVWLEEVSVDSAGGGTPSESPLDGDG